MYVYMCMYVCVCVLLLISYTQLKCIHISYEKGGTKILNFKFFKFSKDVERRLYLQSGQCERGGVLKDIRFVLIKNMQAPDYRYAQESGHDAALRYIMFFAATRFSDAIFLYID